MLRVEFPWLDNVVRAKRPQRLPVVLTPEQVRTILAHLEGEYWLIASLLYGSGLRLKDIDFGYGQLIVRDGKGGKGSDDGAARDRQSFIRATPGKSPETE